MSKLIEITGGSVGIQSTGNTSIITHPDKSLRYPHPIDTVAPAAPLDEPDVIFGSSLIGWYDSRVGITEGIAGRVTRWDDQSPAANFLTNTTPSSTNSPKYISSDDDGTPAVFFDPGESSLVRKLFFSGSSNTNITPEHTVYAFVEAASGSGIALDCLVWSGTGNTGLFTAGFSGVNVERPSVFQGTWYTPAHSDLVPAFYLIRFGGSNAGTLRSIAINDEAEQTAAGSWLGTNPPWREIPRADTSLQYYAGRIKQLIFTDTFVQDADAEHQMVVDWIKSIYPTLVLY